MLHRRPGALLALLFLLAFLVACRASGSTAHQNGTAEMVEALKAVTQKIDPLKNPFTNAARARILEQAVQQPGEATPQHLRDLAVEFLNAGRTQDAIALLQKLESAMKTAGLGPGSPAWIDLQAKKAIAFLRLAEESNCVMHHNASSCLFPIEPSGVHGQQEGSRKAVATLIPLLENNPQDLRSLWLLNVAYMTLGEYPDGVPKRWLLSPELFRSEYDIGRFPDIAGDLGLDVDDLAGGSITDDFDGDGYLDIMVSAMGFESPLRLFRNNADGTFSERSAKAGLSGLTGGLNLLQADYDNDGRVDVLVLRGGWMGSEGHFPNSLLRNQGDGTFADVTAQAGLMSYHPTQTAVWLDFDGDGWLDLFIGNESTPGDPNPNELFRSNGDGTFTDCAREAGVAQEGYVKGVASADFNNDGRPDLYVSILGAPNRLYRNDGPASSGQASPGGSKVCHWKFTDVAESAGVQEPLFSFPTWFFDYDNDGWEDLFVSGYRLKDVGDVAADYLGVPTGGEYPRLYHNQGDGTFTDVTRQQFHAPHLLLTMGSNYGDLDGDGWLDFYAGTGNPNLGMLVPNRMFHNAQGKGFQDVTTSGGFGHLQKGHGVSFADLDNDGDQDIHEVIGGAFEADHFRNALFENPGHGNHWLSLKLEGVKANRAGIGARLKVNVREPGGADRAIYKTARSGGSFGCSPLRQEFGLGQAAAIESVEILWPGSGLRQVLRGLEMDQLYQVREGDMQVKALPLQKFRLGSSSANPGAPSQPPSSR